MTDNLTKYRSKRDFKQTREPSGEIEVKASNRRRFVIQKHDATRLHYDLRIELDGVFKSWAVTKRRRLDAFTSTSPLGSRVCLKSRLDRYLVRLSVKASTPYSATMSRPYPALGGVSPASHSR